MAYTNETFSDGTLKRFNDDDFDSVSMRSSTIFDSDYVASQIRRHERVNQGVAPLEMIGNAINLQIVMNNSGNLIVKSICSCHHY